MGAPTPTSMQSDRGYSWYKDFILCQRRWFLKNIAGIVEVAPRAEALIFGSAVHKYRELRYRGNNADVALSAALADLHDADSRLLLQKQADAWAATLAADLAETHVIAVEVTFELELPNGEGITGRIDAILQDRETNGIYLIDHKSTGWYAAAAYDDCEYQDQMTWYLLAAHHCREQLGISASDVIVGMVPDIFDKKTLRCSRPGIIYRSADELRRAYKEILGYTSALAKRVDAYARGALDEETLWLPGRSAANCKFCPYVAICRISDYSNLPGNLTKEVISC